MRPVGTVSPIRRKLICIIKRRLSSSTKKDETRRDKKKDREREREAERRIEVCKRVDRCMCVIRVTRRLVGSTIVSPFGRSAIGQNFRRVRDAWNKGMIRDESSTGGLLWNKR